MKKFMRPVLALCVVSALIACGDGGDGVRISVPITELAPELVPLVSGRWPLDTASGSRAFLVRDSQEWNDAWLTRKAVLVCQGPSREAACDQPAPAIDFSQYSLVGIVVDPYAYFIAPTPSKVELLEDGSTLYVEYTFAHVVGHVGIDDRTQTRFFLVPRTSARLESRGVER